MTYNQLNIFQVHKIVGEKLGTDWSIYDITTKKYRSCVTLIDPMGYWYSDIAVQHIKNGRIPEKFRAANQYVMKNINHWCELNSKNFRPSKDSKYIKSGENMGWICLECGNVFNKRFNDIQNNKDYQCSSCNDGVSYPQKFVKEFLKQLHEKYIPEYSPKWIKPKRYDFYLPNKNEIWEINGSQHYNGGFESYGGRSLKKEQKNDKLKKEKAIKNGITNYIIIDASKSDPRWIKNNILDRIADSFDTSNIDWDKCHEMACNSLVKTSCNLWGSGIRSTIKISEIIEVHYSTIVKYLKQGAELGWCDYNKGKRKIIQLNLEGIFIKEWNSIQEAETQLNINGISNCCRKQKWNKSAGGYIWTYKEDYKKNKNNVLPYSRNHKGIKIIQLSLNGEFIKEWESMIEAGKKLNITHSGISECCKGNLKSSGGFMWVYKSSFNKDNIKPYKNNQGASKKKVIQISNNGEFIREWNSMTDVERKINISVSQISNCCKNKYGYRLAGGFRWMYYDEYIKQ